MLKLSSVTLLRALEHYGDPKSLAADPDAAEQLCGWGGVIPGTGESRAVGGGGEVERGCASWAMAAAPDQRIRP